MGPTETSDLGEHRAIDAAHARATAALGGELTIPEMAALQAVHQGTPDEIGPIIDYLSEDLVDAAGNASIAPELCRYLSRHPDPIVALAAASNENAEPEDFDRIVAMRVGELGELAALPSHLVDALTASTMTAARTFVAHRITDTNALRRFAHDTDALVRSAVAENPATDAAALLAMCRDTNASVRAAVARHAELPVDGLELLATDGHSAVRRCVSSNPHTAPETLHVLSDDHDPAVRRAVATNPSTGVPAHRRMATDIDNEVRAGVARTAIDPDTLRELLDVVHDLDLVVNPATPSDVLDRIADRSVTLARERAPYAVVPMEDRLIAEQLAAHPNVSDAVMARLVERAFDRPSLEQDSGRALAESINTLAATIAASPRLTAEQATRLSKHPLPAVRANVATRLLDRVPSPAVELAEATPTRRFLRRRRH